MPKLSHYHLPLDNFTDFALCPLPLYLVVYTDLLDRMGHSYGPQSANVEKVMSQLDSALHMVLHELLLEPASSNLHMMLLSDHGMQAISQVKTVHLDWYIYR